MGEPRGGARLPQESLGEDGGRALGWEDLDGHRTLEHRVPPHEDDPHAAGGELALDDDPRGKRGTKAMKDRRRVAHVSGSCRGDSPILRVARRPGNRGDRLRPS